MRHRSINRNSAVASGSSFFNGWRSTPGTTPLTSQLVLLISATTTKVEIGSNAARLRLRSLTCGTGHHARCFVGGSSVGWRLDWGGGRFDLWRGVFDQAGL